MKNRLNVVVLLVEILAITVLHAARLHHTDSDPAKISSHSGLEKPDVSFKKNFASYTAKNN
jgi:hypothetical protein